MPDICTHEMANGKKCGQPTNPICPYCRDHVDEHMVADRRRDMIATAERLNRYADGCLASKLKMAPEELEFVLALRGAGGMFLGRVNNA